MKRRSGIQRAFFMALLVATGCGSEETRIATTPNPSDFSNPSGALTDASATASMNDVLLNQQGHEAIVIAMGGITSSYAEENADCYSTSTDGHTATTDYACLSDAGEIQWDGERCTATGTLTETSEDGYATTDTYDGYAVMSTTHSLSCGSGQIRQLVVPQEPFADIFTCFNFSCEIDGQLATMNTCFGPGAISVDGDGGNVVFHGFNGQTDNCAHATSNWLDKDGALTMNCDVKSKTESCPPDYNSGILEVQNCTVTRQ